VGRALIGGAGGFGSLAMLAAMRHARRRCVPIRYREPSRFEETWEARRLSFRQEAQSPSPKVATRGSVFDR
jgi:hypothetical protein